MRILVTGGAGFLARAVIRRLLQRGDSVVALDTNLAALADLQRAFGERLSAVAGDVTDMGGIALAFQAHRPDAVVHCAAIVGMLATPVAAMRVNAEGSLNVFDAMRLFGVRRCIHVSSEESYGPFRAAVIDEDHPQNPVSAYGVSKLAVEHLARGYRALHGLEVIHLRTSWVYGFDLPRNRIPKNLIDAALANRPLHLAHGGDSAIDQTHIDDFASGTILALDHPQHAFDAYNIASGTAPTLYQMVETIREIVPGAEISVGPGRYRYFGELEICEKGALDVGRARREFGYAPRFDLRAGVREYVERAQQARRAA
jgi:nucleoside-diphosphate-sugar epimerase